jgi:hypothetical protein
MTRPARVITGLCVFSLTALCQRQPPSLSKSFAAATIPVGGGTNLNFVISNPNGPKLSGIGFSDTLPAGLAYASPGSYGFCGGTVVVTSATFTLTGGSLAGGGQCSGGVAVNGLTAGVQNNMTSTIIATGTSAGAAAKASLTVVAAPVISKTFGATAAIPLNGAANLTFSISNPNGAVALTGVAFTNNLPAQLVVANPSGAVNNCGGTLTAIPGTGTITLTGGAIAASGSCAITVGVIGAAEGEATNVSGAIASANGGTGNTASASVFVGDTFQVRYSANIPAPGLTNIPDSVINITNTGASGGVTNLTGTSASLGGSFCVNVYAFSPQEQIVACCSCPVTPDGLVSLSVARDIASNALTSQHPQALVIELLATAPVGGSCIGSAAAATSGTLVPGLAAWGTTPHSTGALGSAPWAVAETPFQAHVLSTTELAHLSNLCSFVIGTNGTNGQGSGFGLCASCRLGGLGAGTSVQ